MVEFDFARPLSAMKYGLLVILASIPAIILMVIVAVVFGTIMWEVASGGELGGGLIIGIVGAIAIVVVVMTASIQVITFALNSAFNDAMSEYQSIGYLETWAKAFSIFLELVYLMAAIIVLLVLGLVISDASPGLGGLFMLVGFIMYILTYAGMIPYVCRRVLEG